MRTYIALYQGKQITLQAETSSEAQAAAAKIFKSKKPWQVMVILADREIDAATL